MEMDECWKEKISSDSRLSEIARLWGLEEAVHELNVPEGHNYACKTIRKIETSQYSGTALPELLRAMNIFTVYIYGIGEMGKALMEEIEDMVKVQAFIDSGAGQYPEGYHGIPVILPQDLPQDDIPVIITPLKYIYDITYSLVKSGIERKRLISLNILPELGMHKVFPAWESDQRRLGHHFLITGAQFHNLGAQSMLFVAVNEIRSRFPDAVIWYLPNDNNLIYYWRLKRKYRMLFLLDGTFLGSDVMGVLPLLTGIVDVSGYSLSSNWKCNRYMKILRMAYHYQVPLYLMPQSFGPFDFEDDMKLELEKLLQHARVIFAREDYGYHLLQETFHLKNVKKSCDMVLQNKGINVQNIYKQKIEENKYCLDTENNVAIIPNIRNYTFGSKAELLELYKRIIEYLLQHEKTIYIISHSNDDLACEDIYEMFTDNEKVHLYQESFDCLGFGRLARNFQYVIASRYHAIVHVLKEKVPCIAIGWTEKYKELLEWFGMETYSFDVRNKLNVEDVLKALDKMNERWSQEGNHINRVLGDIQRENCFDVLKELQ